MGRKFQDRLARPPRTVGVKKIREVVHAVSIQSISRQCGVSISAVAGWCTGDALPQTDKAYAVLRAYGISEQDWRTPVLRK